MYDHLEGSCHYASLSTSCELNVIKKLKWTNEIMFYGSILKFEVSKEMFRHGNILKTIVFKVLQCMSAVPDNKQIFNLIGQAENDWSTWGINKEFIFLIPAYFFTIFIWLRPIELMFKKKLKKNFEILAIIIHDEVEFY